MQKGNILKDRAQTVDKKNGVICLVIIIFTPRVMVIRMLKVSHFPNFLLMTAKN